MAEPFKEWFNPTVIAEIGARFAAIDPSFPLDRYLSLASQGLADLELKDRVRQIAQALHQSLPPAWPQALERVLGVMAPPLPSDDKVAEQVWHWPLLQLVEDQGLEHPQLSLPALAELTRRFSAEFAVRPYLERYPEQAWALLHALAERGDVHQRRLASEGSRPRLPWGRQLKALIQDPSPGLELLLKLRDDPEEYVRRSVANHLNDVAKDHPDRVVALAQAWLAEAPSRQRLLRHALRHLIKQGHPGALAVLGVSRPQVQVQSFTLSKAEVRVGESFELGLSVKNLSPEPQRLIVDYVVHHRRVKGGSSPKVFKWTELLLAPGESRSLRKSHSMRPVTTRRYTPGAHSVELQINGEAFDRQDFELREA